MCELSVASEVPRLRVDASPSIDDRPSVTPQLLDTSLRPTAIPTARELEVLQLAADGLGNREISEELFVSEEAVKSHVQTVLLKLNSESRAQAIVIGIRDGLID